MEQFKQINTLVKEIFNKKEEIFNEIFHKDTNKIQNSLKK